MSGSARVLVVLLCANCASGSYPRAQNLHWKSTNFKTVLTWGPEPTQNYTYTVEFYAMGKNKERSHHCTRSSQTSCDLSAFMTDPHSCYRADVVSEPPLGVTSDLVEFPHQTSDTFCPYNQTDIGRLDFTLETGDAPSVTVVVKDPPTALFAADRQLSVRDVFGDKLQYKVTYRKNGSSGTRWTFSGGSRIRVQGLDAGWSYCFSVQAYVSSRSPDKQLNEMSATRCSRDDDQSLLKVYSPGAIAAIVGVVLLLLAAATGLVVFCHRRRRRASPSGKEGV